MRCGGAAFFVWTPGSAQKDFGHGGGGRGGASDVACGEGRVTWRRRRGGLRDGAAVAGAAASARRVCDACPTDARHDSRSGVAHRAAL